MKKAYVTPVAKIFDICLEEKIAAGCYGINNFTFSGAGCMDVFQGDDSGRTQGNLGCRTWITQNS